MSIDNHNSLHLEIIKQASALKQKFHKEQKKADWSVIENMLKNVGYEDVVCDEAFRCRVKSFERKNGSLKTKDEYRNSELDNKMTDIELKVIELKKEKVKIKDEKNRYSKYIKQEARFEELNDIIKDEIKYLNKTKPISFCKTINKNTNRKSGILQLSDWHFGILADNFANQYTPEVCKKRLADIITRANVYCKNYNIEHLYVLIQGDLISSGIHNVLRIQNQEDLISQIIKSSEYMAESIGYLSEELRIPITISCVLDNHSRVTPDKKDSIEKENYMRITEWFLKERFYGIESIKFLDTGSDPDMCIFDIYDYKCISVHGHKDKFNGIAQRLTTFTRNIYDYIFTSHHHHLHMEEINMVDVISNGSLSGVDEHSKNLRMSSHPMQMLSIIDKEIGMEIIIPIRTKE